MHTTIAAERAREDIARTLTVVAGRAEPKAIVATEVQKAGVRCCCSDAHMTMDIPKAQGKGLFAA